MGIISFTAPPLVDPPHLKPGLTSTAPPLLKERREYAMSSSKKRKAPEADIRTASTSGVAVSISSSAAAAAAAPGNERPLVWATPACLEALRHKIRAGVEETMETELAKKHPPGVPAPPGNGTTSVHGSAASQHEDPAMTAYLKAFPAAVMDKVRTMCRVQEPREAREEDELFEAISRHRENVRAARDRLESTRARIARLSADTCAAALRVSRAADERAGGVLEASIAHARREKEAGGPLPLRPAAAAGSGSGSDDNLDEEVMYPVGVDLAAVEHQASALIGNLSELPGPLKAVRQEIPELTASIATSMKSVGDIMAEGGGSQTEALFDKAPPTPLPGKRRKRAAGGGGAAENGGGERNEEEHPAEEVRSAARGARVGQARKEWQAEGLGVAGGMVGGLFH